MEVLPIVLTIVVVVTIALIAGIVLFRGKNNVNGDDVSDVAACNALESVQENEVAIPIERLPATVEIDEKSLYEITDLTVISRISQTIPAIAETATRTVANNALKNTELYKAVIPSGATLTKSKQMKGAVRGYFHGSKGVKGQANLIKVDPTQLSKSTAIANGVANVMNVGSLVVGQYYMSEINSKLESMGKTLDKVSDFQDKEFKSRIFSLLARVGKISQFSAEIIENDEVRIIKLTALEDLEGIATELLGQVNITITGMAQKSRNPDYQEYQKYIEDFGVLYEYQTVLLSALEEISKLTYLLGKGEISSDMSYTLFNTYRGQSIQTRNALKLWHDRQTKALRIELKKNRISKSGIDGIVSGVVSAIPILGDDNWNYKELEQGLADKISAQSKNNLNLLEKPLEIYEDNVEIIIKDGKYYYLHEAGIGEAI